MLELLIVLSLLAVMAGVALPGAGAVRGWLARSESQSLFRELESACQLYWLERGAWPEGLLKGEVALDDGGQDWREEVAPYMERRLVGEELADGHGNTRLLLVVDGDGDRWIEAGDFSALDVAERPERLWRRVAVYSLDADGRLAAASWER